jgi:hypothetical protein
MHIILPSESMFNKQEYMKNYYQKNKEKHDETTKEWAKNNPNYQKDYYTKNREREVVDSCAYQKNNLEKVQNNHRAWYHEKRMQAFKLLGNKCVICGETDWTCLQIDHINGGGCQHHKRRQSYGIIVDVIKDSNAKSKYQLLCANCNWKKRFKLKEHNDHNKMWEFRKPQP